MLGESREDLWWKNGLIYCLDVETYLDSDGDGVGDFHGLMERVDYLASLGVTCIWLMPFYPTPSRDDGYDVCDYYNVDRRLGTLGDFNDFIYAARARGIRVIADLVVNHTSDQHEWFQSARSDPESPFRKFYVWRDQPPEGFVPSLVFPGEQDSNWTFDEAAGQYYFHHFYPHQPDLNAEEPAVRDEMSRIIGFWVQQGVQGFRVDAVPYLIETLSEGAKEEIASHGFLRAMRSFLSYRRGDAVLLGEVNLLPHEQLKFFGSGDELHLIFNFYVNQHLFLSLARRDPDPLRKALEGMPEIPAGCQWANFIKNHDEANFDKLTPTEREEVFDAFGPEPSMQLYGRGLRRRLPTMLGGNDRLVRLTYSLLFSLPGTPVLYYGEEIGMGENLAVEGRLAVRTPMQWKPMPGGGFSSAPVSKLLRPPPKGEFSPENVNVASQRLKHDSLLSWMQHIIRVRIEVPEFGFGKCSVYDCGSSDILALKFDWAGRVILTLHNFNDRPRTANIGQLLAPDLFEIADLWADKRYRPVEGDRVEVSGLGYRWLAIRRKGQEQLL